MGSTFLDHTPLVVEGDTVIVYVSHMCTYAVNVRRGQLLQTKYGALRHEFMIDKPYGSKVTATKGFVYLLRNTPELWCRALEHRTQILYPPDVALCTLLMDLSPGKIVLEAGTGSGAASHAYARAIAPTGHLYTFDIEPNRVQAANKDFENNKYSKFITAEHRDACTDGFGMEDIADAVFLDMPCPWKALPFAKKALKKNVQAKLVSFSPCIEQVTQTCDAMRELGFVRIEMVEIVPKKLKVVSSRMEQLVPRNEESVVDADVCASVDGEPPAKRSKLSEDQQKCVTKGIVTPNPAQQPTHTGYLTVGTLA